MDWIAKMALITSEDWPIGEKNILSDSIIPEVILYSCLSLEYSCLLKN